VQVKSAYRSTKEGGYTVHAFGNENRDPYTAADVDVLALDDALARLATMDPRKARLVELRYFAGLSIEDTADALGMSPATLKRRFALARAWLFRELSGAA
jgi:DNA-directed RNA polymerase specialized sigma24 family protein